MSRFTLGRVPIDPLSLTDALDRIATLVGSGEGGTVFTPNVDHVVLAEQDPRFEKAYGAVSLSLIDGTPVLWACRMLGGHPPEKVSGSDLTYPLLARAAVEGWRVFLLGPEEKVVSRAVTLLRSRLPRLVIVGADSRVVDMDSSPDTRSALLDVVHRSRPDIVLVSLGSPKAELWAHEARERLRPAVLVSVGAALDFLTGSRRRAPSWMSSHGLEWLFRLGLEPRRLWKRYLLRDPRFLPIVLRCLRDRLWQGSGRL